MACFDVLPDAFDLGASDPLASTGSPNQRAVMVHSCETSRFEASFIPVGTRRSWKFQDKLHFTSTAGSGPKAEISSIHSPIGWVENPADFR